MYGMSPEWNLPQELPPAGMDKPDVRFKRLAGRLHQMLAND